MKVQELRQLLKDADRSLLEKAFVESYKQFSKSKKEDIDLMISDILAGKDSKESVKNEIVNFEALKLEIETFIENAYAQNYYAPNRVIPKSQRPKWRFLVKGYIKELDKIPPENTDCFEAVKLLNDLYHLICNACNYYYFSTDDPFRSIGWLQPDSFELLVKKTFALEYSKENISSLLLTAATGGLSRESLHIQQMFVLLASLKTADVKYMAIEEAKTLIEKRKSDLSKLKKYDNREYYLKDAINNLCEMILITSVALSEPETGIDYFFKNCQERDREIILYRALDLMNWMDEDELWIEFYKYGLVKKIKPRESLVREYEARLEKSQK